MEFIYCSCFMKLRHKPCCFVFIHAEDNYSKLIYLSCWIHIIANQIKKNTWLHAQGAKREDEVEINYKFKLHNCFVKNNIIMMQNVCLTNSNFKVTSTECVLACTMLPKTEGAKILYRSIGDKYLISSRFPHRFLRVRQNQRNNCISRRGFQFSSISSLACSKSSVPLICARAKRKARIRVSAFSQSAEAIGKIQFTYWHNKEKWRLGIALSLFLSRARVELNLLRKIELLPPPSPLSHNSTAGG